MDCTILVPSVSKSCSVLGLQCAATDIWMYAVFLFGMFPLALAGWFGGSGVGWAFAGG